MKEMIMILIGASIINNVVLSQFMGICAFLGTSKQLKNSVGMGLAVVFVMTFATLVTYPVYILLDKIDATYLKTVAFILVIALFVQLAEMAIKRFIPPLYKALGVYLPLITTNCAVLGAAITNVDRQYTLDKSLVNSVGTGLGFTLALVLFAGVRYRLESSDIPETFKGVPATLVAAAIVSLSFMGFAGIV